MQNTVNVLSENKGVVDEDIQSPNVLLCHIDIIAGSPALVCAPVHASDHGWELSGQHQLSWQYKPYVGVREAALI